MFIQINDFLSEKRIPKVNLSKKRIQKAPADFSVDADQQILL